MSIDKIGDKKELSFSDNHEPLEKKDSSQGINRNENTWNTILKRNHRIKVEMAIELVRIGFPEDLAYLFLNIEQEDEY